MKLTEHVTLEEFIKSSTASRLGIDNTPPLEHIDNIKLLLDNVFEPLRKGLGDKPIYISCGYRGKELNNATPNASKTSFHCSGKAMDLDDTFGHCTNKDIFMYIYNNLPYAEMVWEYGSDYNPDWVHVAFDKGKNVKETLRCTSIKGKPSYEKFDIKKIK